LRVETRPISAEKRMHSESRPAGVHHCPPPRVHLAFAVEQGFLRTSGVVHVPFTIDGATVHLRSLAFAPVSRAKETEA
jgi:hypothetical protein